MLLRSSYMSCTIIFNIRPPPPPAVILFSLSDKTNPDDSNAKPPQRQKKTSRIPRQPQQVVARKPSVAEIERAIGAGIYKDRDINRESEQEKTLFDTILSNSIGRTEGDVEKKLRETGEWILNKTEGPSRSTGKNILKVVFLWILPLWILSFLVAFGVIRLPFVSPFLDEFIM
uniref:probable NAD(P)H dehydrogenase subunit CRR3, chloroplastic n=1 Tax=Erigeron canadensis TaxID=72917 RepID=UPI001CB987B3|nr:probable NAD(P)H dehydrogenase subunit CRR3, chloroplastic [Erigeron canadensis]